jgi:hypothetical protein
MNMNLFQQASVLLAFPPAAQTTAAGTVVGAILDTLGWGDVTFLCGAANGTSGVTTFQVETDSDSAMGSPTALTGATVAITEALHDDGGVIRIANHARERYMRIRATVTVANATGVSAFAVLEHGKHKPHAQAIAAVDISA